MQDRFYIFLLLLSAICLFGNMPAVHAQDSQSAQDLDDEDRDSALQKAFKEFPLLASTTNSDRQPEFQTLELKNPVVINRERFFGFRFKVPPRTNHEDLVWAFVLPGGLKEWYIVPETGDMDGFTNYYTTSKGDYMGGNPLLPINANRMILQYLEGDNLKDGQTCLIWFGFGNYNPPSLSLAFTFANYNQDSPHPKVAMERLLALNQLTSEAFVNPENHHKYMLLRLANWERSEQLAEHLGGHLATIRNQSEENWIFKTFGHYGGTRRLLWTGLNDLDKRFHFSWASGESASYSDWAPYEPNNAGPRGEDYVAIYNPGNRNENEWRVWNNRSRAAASLPMDGVVEIVPTNYVANSVSGPAGISSVEIHPNMTITSQNGSITLDWPLSASDFILMATTNLSQPFAQFGYSEETNIASGTICVTITNPSAQMFFKLEKPPQ